ncbi:hypothetical protein ACHAO1_006143 [Botrytis cinerea]
MIAQPQIANASAPTLLHADLHTQNICIPDEDPTSLTRVIDQQSSSTEPAFIYTSDMADFARAPKTSSESEHPSPEPPSSEQDRTQKELHSQEDAGIAIPRCITHPTIPTLRHTSQLNSAAALRQEFLHLSSKWENIDLAGKYPYVAIPEELARHQKQHRAFERAQELKQMLMQLLFVDSDGWVSIEHWEEVRRAHKVIYELALENVEEEGDDSMTEKNLRELCVAF